MAARATGWWLAALLLGSGCERVTAALEDQAQRVAEHMAPAPEPRGITLSEHELLERKLTLYLECHDAATQRIRDSWQRLSERVSDDGAPRKKGVEPFLYKVDSELVPCIAAARKGPLVPPPLPEIEQTMASYLEHAERFAALSVELDTYYEEQGYQADDWARSKELVPELASAFEAWSEAAQQLDVRVEARRAEVEQARLAEVEQHQGRDLEWHARDLLIVARALTRCLTAEGATAEGCAEAHEALVTAHEGLVEAIDAAPQRAEAVFWMTSFRSAAQRYRKAADAAHAARGKDSAAALGELRRAFEALAADAKNLRFDR